MASYEELRTDTEIMHAIDEILYGDHPTHIPGAPDRPLRFSTGDSLLFLIRAIQRQAYEDGGRAGRIDELSGIYTHDGTIYIYADAGRGPLSQEVRLEDRLQQLKLEQVKKGNYIL